MHSGHWILGLCGALLLAMLGGEALPAPGEEAPPERGLFSWSSGRVEDWEELFQTMEDQGLTVLYQHISRDTEEPAVRRFLLEAARRGVQVWMLTGSPSWGLDPSGERMGEEMERAARYNELLPEIARLRGVLMDSEPYLTEEWEEDPDGVMESWVSAMERARGEARERDLALMACIPYYLDDQGYTDRLEQLMDEGCDALAIMNYYRKDEAGQIETEAALARAHGRPVTVIYELQAPGEHGLEEKNTYYHDGLPAVEESWAALTEALGPDGLTPALHEYEALREMTGYE